MFENEQKTALPMNITASAAPGVVNVGGILEIRSGEQLIADEKAKAEADNDQAVVQGLAGYIQACWHEAQDAKENTIEPAMLSALRQRKGEYDPDMLAQLRKQGSTPIFMLITSNKCRAGASWLREALDGLPWSAKPTPVSDVDDDTKQAIISAAAQQVYLALMNGYRPSDAEVKEFMLAVRDQAFAKIQEMAKQRAERMTEKMKDQLIEGGFEAAMDQFIDDLVRSRRRSSRPGRA